MATNAFKQLDQLESLHINIGDTPELELSEQSPLFNEMVQGNNDQASSFTLDNPHRRDNRFTGTASAQGHAKTDKQKRYNRRKNKHPKQGKTDMVETITMGVTTAAALTIYAALANWLVNINYAVCCQLPFRKNLYIGLTLALAAAGYTAGTRGNLTPGWIELDDVVIITVSAIMTAFQIWRERARSARETAEPQPEE